ncbi:MAG: polyprenol phosphomannose-dependent alpha 1,6 mannosyltransferase MptB [Acidimicrobiales bacterium]
MAVAGPALVEANDGPATRWWYVFTIAPRTGDLGNLVVFYAGMITLSVAWLALGRRLVGGLGISRPGGPGPGGPGLGDPRLGTTPNDRARVGVRPRHVCLVAVAWAIPLVIGPALFSRDIYSYGADGVLANLQLNPYSYGPGFLGVWGHQSLLNAVAPVWRSTVAPYGPTFIALAGLITRGASNLVSAVIGLRMPELLGVGLIALFVPRLARLLGADEGRAVWLAVLSPVMLLSLVAAGHNDALMAGLMVAGIALALERRPLLGILACALAATVKLPAAAGVVFIAVAWARDQPLGVSRARALLTAGLGTAAVFVGVTVASGNGWGWLSFQALSTPGQVVVIATPSTALGSALAAGLHGLGLGPSTSTVVSAARLIGFAAAGLVGAWLLWRTRFENLVLCLGLTLLGVVVAGPVTWPWYLAWSVPLLVTWPAIQRSRALVVTLATFGFVIGPAGSSLMSRSAAPEVALVVVVLSVVAFRRWRHCIRDQLASANLGERPSSVASWRASQVVSSSQSA